MKLPTFCLTESGHYGIIAFVMINPQTERTERPSERPVKKVNPLDASMTKAQVVRRRFKSSLPRTILNKYLSKMEAMAKVMELLDHFRSEMATEGLPKSDVSAGLVYCQPATPGIEDVTFVVALPAPEEIGTFVDKVMALDNPLFLGVLFIQTDREDVKPEKLHTIFVWPFMGGPEAEKRLLAARRQQAKGGLKPAAC
jgi:hypothetical protein